MFIHFHQLSESFSKNRKKVMNKYPLRTWAPLLHDHAISVATSSNDTVALRRAARVGHRRSDRQLSSTRRSPPRSVFFFNIGEYRDSSQKNMLKRNVKTCRYMYKQKNIIHAHVCICIIWYVCKYSMDIYDKCRYNIRTYLMHGWSRMYYWVLFAPISLTCLFRIMLCRCPCFVRSFRIQSITSCIQSWNVPDFEKLVKLLENTQTCPSRVFF